MTQERDDTAQATPLQQSRQERLRRVLGMDRAVTFTLLGRGWSFLAGPLSLLLLASFLSKEEQGYYFTFLSIAGLTALFELGLSTVLTQITSHESAHLEWTPAGNLTGSAAAKARLASLIRTAVLWYGVAALLIAVVIGPVGFSFFSRRAAAFGNVQWQAPWLAVILATALALALTPWYALLEGSGLVAETARVRLEQGVISSLLAWCLLVAGFGLFAAASMGVAAVIRGGIWLTLQRGRALADLWRSQSHAVALRWWSEVWPMQWRIALSWASGYFIFQLFVPTLFAYKGPIEAGQMGLSLSVVGGINAVAMAWTSTKAPRFGVLIARRQFNALDKEFRAALSVALCVAFSTSALFVATVAVLTAVGVSITDRLLPVSSLCILVGTSIANVVVFSEAIYLRAHKQEPFLWMSVTSAALTAASTIMWGRRWGAFGMVTGYAAVTAVVGLGFGTAVFLDRRRAWHSNGSGPI